MKVLVTGSSGRIGSAVAARFSSVAEVVGLDIKPGDHTTMVGNIADADLVSTAVRGLRSSFMWPGCVPARPRAI